MHDDLLEFGPGSKLLIDMQTVIIPAQGRECLDVFAANRLADTGARADFEKGKRIAAVVGAGTLFFGVPIRRVRGSPVLTFQHCRPSPSTLGTCSRPRAGFALLGCPSRPADPPP